MQYSESLKFNHVFQRLYHRGTHAANHLLVIYSRKNGRQTNRLGLTVGAKLGKAVRRNHLRRRLREIYRLHESEFLPGQDIVIVARGRAMEADYADLEKACMSLAAKVGILRKEAGRSEKAPH